MHFQINSKNNLQHGRHSVMETNDWQWYGFMVARCHFHFQSNKVSIFKKGLSSVTQECNLTMTSRKKEYQVLTLMKKINQFTDVWGLIKWVRSLIVICWISWSRTSGPSPAINYRRNKQITRPQLDRWVQSSSFQQLLVDFGTQGALH